MDANQKKRDDLDITFEYGFNVTILNNKIGDPRQKILFIYTSPSSNPLPCYFHIDSNPMCF